MEPDPIVLTKPVYIKDRHCGYCKNEKEDFYALETWKLRAASNEKSSSVTMGTELERIRCEHYDQLVNRGFRRSGVFLYKTDQLRNCCRYYTIRTNLKHLKLEKKHRQVVNRFVRAICGNEPKPDGKFDLNSLLQAEALSTRFRTQFEPSEFTEEKYNLYKKYQVSVHNDKPEDITINQFTRFLCNNPFTEEEQEGEDAEWESLDNWKNGSVASTKRIGPTHECYYLDDKLIAISILDFLPSGISSIYFIWDPDYAHLSLGSLSGLREILMADKMGYEYYYLGYYIDDCDKMKYKGKFGGEILDLVNSTYYPLSQVKPFMANGRFFVMGKEGDHHEPELFMGFPRSGPGPASPAPKNIADDIYNKETMKEADDKLQQLKARYGYDTEFPSVVPGLIPLHQLTDILDDLQGLQTMIYHLSKGFHRKPFALLSKKEKISIINCIRLFGVDLVRKMVVIEY